MHKVKVIPFSGNNSLERKSFFLVEIIPFSGSCSAPI